MARCISVSILHSDSNNIPPSTKYMVSLATGGRQWVNGRHVICMRVVHGNNSPDMSHRERVFSLPDASEIIYGDGDVFVGPWTTEKEALVFLNSVKKDPSTKNCFTVMGDFSPPWVYYVQIQTETPFRYSERVHVYWPSIPSNQMTSVKLFWNNRLKSDNPRGGRVTVPISFNTSCETPVGGLQAEDLCAHMHESIFLAGISGVYFECIDRITGKSHGLQNGDTARVICWVDAPVERYEIDVVVQK